MTLMPWRPRFTLKPNIVNGLLQIEAAKTIVERAPLSATAQAELRRRARLRSTHFSTRIEGNRLTLAETEQVIEAARTFKGRARDVREVQHYWQALLWVEAQAGRKAPLTEALIKKLHTLVEHGLRAKPTPYRDGQNVIRDSITRGIIYLPPEAKDVPKLMRGMVQWVMQAEHDGLSVPLIAGLVHYQFVTIHPYYDGNARTARLLATFILHRGGYGLNGFVSVEEQHARDLDRYYTALATHPHHNYYGGRAEADLSGWLAYFVRTLATGFEMTAEEASRQAETSPIARPRAAHAPVDDPRLRIVLGLFRRQPTITSADVATALGLSTRMARVLLAGWVAGDQLIMIDPSKKGRRYGDPRP